MKCSWKGKSHPAQQGHLATLGKVLTNRNKHTYKLEATLPLQTLSLVSLQGITTHKYIFLLSLIIHVYIYTQIRTYDIHMICLIISLVNISSTSTFITILMALFETRSLFSKMVGVWSCALAQSLLRLGLITTEITCNNIIITYNLLTFKNNSISTYLKRLRKQLEQMQNTKVYLSPKIQT